LNYSLNKFKNIFFKIIELFTKPWIFGVFILFIDASVITGGSEDGVSFVDCKGKGGIGGGSEGGRRGFTALFIDIILELMLLLISSIFNIPIGIAHELT
jgi:hypothetical protein